MSIKQKLKVCCKCNLKKIIWKNIKGHKFCRECSIKIEGYKLIDEISEKKKESVEKKKEQTNRQFQLFLEIWKERKINGRNYCEVSGQILPTEPLSIYFDHLLEKNSYPQFRMDKRNIIIVSGDIHALKTNGFPLLKHKELIEKVKKILL